MKRFSILFFTAVLAFTSLSAQEADIRKVAEKYKNVNTLTASVTQTRHNEAVSEDVVANGFFYFKNTFMSMVFSEEKEMLVTDGKLFVMVREGKTHTARGKGKGNNPFEILLTVFKNIFSGKTCDDSLTEVADVKLAKKAGFCTVTVTPVIQNEKAKRRMIFRSFVATVDLTSAELCSLCIHEKGGNYTRYDFSDYLSDVEISDSVFDPQSVL